MLIVIDIPEEDYNRIKDIPEAFNSLPTRAFKSIKNGTPLPKGKWTSATLGGYTCSNCNKEFTYPRFIGRALYYYCPNCGAKMSESEEEE